MKLRYDRGFAKWLPLAALVAAYGAAMDLWLARTGRAMMTADFHRALRTHPVGSPVLFGLWCGTFAGFTYHFVAESIPRRVR